MTVRLVSPTLPLPESTSPLANVMPPLDVPAIVPWQITGSVIVPIPPKPSPAGTVSVVPWTWTGSPVVVKPASRVNVSKPAGTVKSELEPMAIDRPLRFFQVPVVRSTRQLAPSEAGLLPPSKVPWFTKLPPTWSAPPVNRYVPPAAIDSAVIVLLPADC